MTNKKKLLAIVLTLVVSLQLTALAGYTSWASDDPSAGKTPAQAMETKDVSGEAAGENGSADKADGGQAEKPAADEANGSFVLTLPNLHSKRRFGAECR